MPQPITLGTVLGGRYIVLDEVLITPEQDHVLGGKDQILGREVTILVPSEAHTSRVVENARSMAIGAVEADLHILDLGQSGSTPYLVTSFAAPTVLLEALLAQPGAIDDDTLSDDIFGRPRSSSGAGSYVTDDGEPDSPRHEETSEEVYDVGEDDIDSAPAAPRVEKHLGRTRRAPEASTRATLFDRAAAGRGSGSGSPSRPQSTTARDFDPSYDGDNRYDSYEYEYEKGQPGSGRSAAGGGRAERDSSSSRRGATAAAQRSPSGSPTRTPARTVAAAGAAGGSGGTGASGATAGKGGGSSSATRRGSGPGRLARLGLVLLGLLVLLAVGVGIVFGGLGRVFDSVPAIGPGGEPSASAAPTQQPAADIASVVRLVPEDPTLMADQDATLDQAIDGDPATTWTSYGFSSAEYGQLVSSVALGLRFEEPTPVREVTISQISGTGGSFTVYAADQPSLQDATAVGEGSFEGPETTVELDEAASQEDHPYLIIEWTELPTLEEPIAGYPFGLRIAEIDVA